MSKNKEEKIENPFNTFDILKGQFIQPPNDDTDDNTDDIPLDDNEEQDEPEFSQESEDALNKVIEQQSKAKDKANTAKTDNDDESEEDDSEDNTNQSNGYIDAIKDLSQKGILEFDSDEIEDSEEGLEKAINETVNNKIKKHIAGFGDEALDFLAFIENGGNPRDFISTYYGNESWEDFSLESESAQKTAIRESLRLAGESPEEIEDLITTYEDTGILEKRAKVAKDKLIKKEAEQKVQLIELQKQRDAAEKEANRKYWNDFKSDLDKKEDLKGFKLTPKLKESLWKHMTMIDKSTGKTAYQLAIENDRDAQLLFALQSMNKFDISKLEKQVESKVVSKVSGILKNYQPSSKEKISSGRTHVDKDGEDPFALFGSIRA
jgi:hypothetical protein